MAEVLTKVGSEVREKPVKPRVRLPEVMPSPGTFRLAQLAL